MTLHNSTGITLSDANSTMVPLGVGASFVGETEDVRQYEEVSISVFGTPAVAPGDFYFEFSPDGVNWDVSVLVSGATIAGPRSLPPQILRIILPFFRVRYVNGGTPLTVLRLMTIYHRTGAIRLSRYLNQELGDGEAVQVNRSITSFRDDGTGLYVNVSDARPLPVDAGTVVLTEPVSVDDNGGSLTVDTPQLPAALVGGRLDANVGAWLGSTAPTVGQKTSANSVPTVLASDQSALPVTDNAGSLTVDNPILSVVGGGTEAAAQRVTLANDSTGVLSVDDNGGSLTVDTPQLPAALVGGRLDGNVGAWLGSTAPTVGQKTSANSIPTVLASDQSALPVTDNAGSLTVDNPILSVVGGGTEAAAQRVTLANDSTGVLSVDDNGGSLTVDTPQLPAVLVGGRLDGNVGAWLGSTAPTVGQKTSANSIPTVLASDQSALPVTDNAGSLTVDNPILSVVGGGTEAAAQRVTLANDSTGILSVDDNGGSLTVDTPQLPAVLVGGRLDGNVGAWLGSTAPTVGQKTAASSLPVVIASDQSALPVSGTVSVTEPVSVDDNGGSLTVDTPQLPAALIGGRLDENVGAWLGSTAPTVGSKTSANSIPVVLASDQATRSPTSSTGANTSIAAAIADTQILVANGSRRGATVFNESATGNLRLLLGTTPASATNYTVLMLTNAYYEVPFGYTGEIRGIWTLAVGSARVTELT